MGNATGLKAARKPSPRNGGSLTPRPVSWVTTDADEIAVRRERATEELVRITNFGPHEPVFAGLRVRSASGGQWTVEAQA